MKAAAGILGDVVVCGVAIVWCWLGLWISPLGFSVYHSRGDVWLPTPPEASAFFLGMVLTGTFGFALVFLLISSTLLLLRSRAKTSGRPSKGQRFNADAYRRAVRYFAFLLSVFLSPYFYNFMWRFHGSRSFRIGGGLAISLILFTGILIAGELLAPQQLKKNLTPLNP